MQLPGGILCVPVPSETPLPHKAFNCALVTDLANNRKKISRMLFWTQLIHVAEKWKAN